MCGVSGQWWARLRPVGASHPQRNRRFDCDSPWCSLAKMKRKFQTNLFQIRGLNAKLLFHEGQRHLQTIGRNAVA